MTEPTSRTDARSQLLAAAVLVVVLVGTIVAATGGLPAGIPGDTGQPATPSGPSRLGAGVGQLHAEGVTGENVTVAVLDPTGFDTDHPALAGRVAAARAFASGEDVENGGRNDHGTGAAAVVARAAPAAELYLASFDTADGYVAAVDWLVRQDVDVIVAPLGFYGKWGDGNSRVARAAAAAVDRGVVFVAPAGNLGRSHWRGDFSPNESGVHQFRGGPRNFLLGDEGRVSLWLSWSGGPPDASFDLELYRTNGTAARLVARSQPYPGDAVPNARIVADVDAAGTYYVVVRGPPAAAGTRIALSSPTHRLQYRTRARSVVAPATAEPVVAVGAYDQGADRVAPFSSAGPVGDGRAGVDVVAPARQNVSAPPVPFEGSSAAAAYVAGVAALVLDVESSLSPATVEGILRTTARDVGPAGVDTRSGAGLVAPRRAVDRARNVTQS